MGHCLTRPDASYQYLVNDASYDRIRCPGPPFSRLGRREGRFGRPGATWGAGEAAGGEEGEERKRKAEDQAEELAAH